MRIRKRTPAGVLVVEYTGEVARREGTCLVIHATWVHADRDLGYTIFARGDRFIEYFYSDQWFNIIRVHSVTDGALKGWYGNINRPAIFTDETIDYDDLYLDVWFDAARQPLVLDEDEFVAATLDDATRAGARAGVAEILRWSVQGLGPFGDHVAASKPISGD